MSIRCRKLLLTPNKTDHKLDYNIIVATLRAKIMSNNSVTKNSCLTGIRVWRFSDEHYVTKQGDKRRSCFDSQDSGQNKALVPWREDSEENKD